MEREDLPPAECLTDDEAETLFRRLNSDAWPYPRMRVPESAVMRTAITAAMRAAYDLGWNEACEACAVAAFPADGALVEVRKEGRSHLSTAVADACRFSAEQCRALKLKDVP